MSVEPSIARSPLPDSDHRKPCAQAMEGHFVPAKVYLSSVSCPSSPMPVGYLIKRPYEVQIGT